MPAFPQGGTESGTLAPKPSTTPVSTLPADLAELVNAWPALAPAIRIGILAMIQAAKTGA